jgi:hypothetical protein
MKSMDSLKKSITKRAGGSGRDLFEIRDVTNILRLSQM